MKTKIMSLGDRLRVEGMVIGEKKEEKKEEKEKTSPQLKICCVKNFPYQSSVKSLK